ncbi:MAG: hypothetical protein AAF217_00825 [Pseudomonadota bacterium]
MLHLKILSVLTTIAVLYPLQTHASQPVGETQAASVSTHQFETGSGHSVHVIDQDLPEFLREAARRNGYEITITKRVRGKLKQKTLPLDLGQIMPRIAPQFDLKWHFQQKQLFVSVGSENTSRLIYLGAMDMETLDVAMLNAGMNSKAFDLSYVEDSNSLIVNGPVSYIAGIELLAESYNKNHENRKSKVKVIRFGHVGN